MYRSHSRPERSRRNQNETVGANIRNDLNALVRADDFDPRDSQKREQLFQIAMPLVEKLVNRKMAGAPPQDRADTVQGVLVKLFRRLDTDEGISQISNLPGWLSAVVRSETIDYWNPRQTHTATGRREQHTGLPRNEDGTVRDIPADPEMSVIGQTPDKPVEERDFDSAVDQFFSALKEHIPAIHAEIIELRYRREMTHAEIAKELGIPAGTSMSRTKRALKYVMDLVQERPEVFPPTVKEVLFNRLPEGFEDAALTEVEEEQVPIVAEASIQRDVQPPTVMPESTSETAPVEEVMDAQDGANTQAEAVPLYEKRQVLTPEQVETLLNGLSRDVHAYVYGGSFDADYKRWGAEDAKVFFLKLRFRIPVQHERNKSLEPTSAGMLGYLYAWLASRYDKSLDIAKKIEAGEYSDPRQKNAEAYRADADVCKYVCDRILQIQPDLF